MAAAHRPPCCSAVPPPSYRVVPGTISEYTLTVFGTVEQNFAGVSVAAPLGTLSVGGPFAEGTQALPGLLGLAEITHTAPKQGDFLNVVEFSFLWTAPVSFTSATLRAWGNAVDANHTNGGDAAGLATLQVFARASNPTPTIYLTPTPTATPPAVPCDDAAPLQPPLVADPAAQACQAAIAKGGAAYLKKDHKAVRKCLEAFQAAEGGSDPVAACVGGSDVLPTDAKTTAAIVKAQGKALSLLQDKCSDAAVAALDACGDTASGLAQCFLNAHRQAVVDVIAQQYGAVVPSGDKGTLKCQKAIGSAGAAHLIAHLRAGQKCLVLRNKEGMPPDGDLECIGAVAAEAFAAPRNVKVDSAETSGAVKLLTTIDSKCSDAQIAALDTCGSNRETAAACLLCAHRTAVFAVISDEFGGLP
jgi:hypothetical protein